MGSTPDHDSRPSIATCEQSALPEVLAVINDSAKAYESVIPPDCWHDPYMTALELSREIQEGVRFHVWSNHRKIEGVMGIQDLGDVALIRHAYVLTSSRRQGIGRELLQHLLGLTTKPVLIGTWRAATWAIRFYEGQGFSLIEGPSKDRLLRKYWKVSNRQIEESVVLGNTRVAEWDLRSVGCL